MPTIKHSLRDLAERLEGLGRAHPAWGQAQDAVLAATGHLSALARVAEINQDEARPYQVLQFSYVNYNDFHRIRRVNPISIRWGTSEWYKEPQWLLMCWDLDKKDRREFAIARMSSISQLDRDTI